MNLNDTKEYRSAILLAELTAYLHDLGKLNWFFLEKHLEGKKNNYDHTNIFSLDRDAGLLSNEIFNKLGITFDQYCEDLKKFIDNNFILREFLNKSLIQLVSGHHGRGGGPIQRLFNQADKLESAEEQGLAKRKQSIDIFIDNGFGFERSVNYNFKPNDPKKVLERLRIIIYEQLNKYLKGNISYINLLHEIRSMFRQSLGKTQRQVNDTTLEQHAWGVASRFKAFFIRDLLDKTLIEGNYAPRNTFRFLSITWDSWQILTPYERLIDLTARQQLLQELKLDLETKIEDEFAFGSCIYRDEDGIHFMVADLDWDENQIKTTINDWIVNKNNATFPWKVEFSEPTDTVTSLIDQIDKMKDSPWVWPSWETPVESGQFVCKICHKAASLDTDGICDWCNELRNNVNKENIDAGSVWNGELVDSHGTLSLLVLHFDLHDWLNGNMLKTVFSAHFNPLLYNSWKDLDASLASYYENFSQYLQNKNRQKQLKKISQNQTDNGNKTELEELDQQISTDENQFSNFNLNENYVSFTEEYLKRSTSEPISMTLCSKYPTTNRLLNIWQTAEKFFNDQITQIRNIDNRKRYKFTLDNWLPQGFYQVQFQGIGILQVYAYGNEEVVTIDYLSEERCSVIEENYKNSIFINFRSNADNSIPKIIGKTNIEYKPYRVINKSPNLLMVLVPAKNAIEILDTIKKNALEQFNKVQGRFPLHAGLIFMKQHYPMFAGLDAARRLTESLQRLSRQQNPAEIMEITPGDPCKLRFCNSNFGEWEWNIKPKLGNGDPDIYYPYMLVAPSEDKSDTRDKTLAFQGSVLMHVDDLLQNDRLLIRPNLFSYISLETVSDRILTNLSEFRKPLSDMYPQPNVYIFDRFNEFKDIWDWVSSSLSSSQYRAVLDLLIQKRGAWLISNKDEFDWLVDMIVRRDLKGNEKIKKDIKDGIFFDAMDLFIHILKSEPALALTTTSK